MIFGQDRNELRKMYADAWAKRCEELPLSPLETQIADVIEMHPEYHADVSGEDLERDYSQTAGRRTHSCTWACIWAFASRFRPIDRLALPPYTKLRRPERGISMRLSTK